VRFGLPVRFGIEVVTLGPLADPRRVVELAAAAEEAGFELVAVWDHHAYVWGVPSADAVVTLTAVAQATTRIRLLPTVIPIARHVPHVLALQLANLDVLSGGRLIVGVGLGGVAEEFTAFGQPASARDRAERVDEALDVMTGLWSGAEVNHSGRHYRVDGVTLAPTPVQRPRPQVWIGGESEGALRRAARWDGWVIGGTTEDGGMAKSPADMTRLVETLRTAGARVGEGFEVAMSGVTHGPGAADPASYAAAGVTWWLESLSPSYGEPGELLRRARAGPPA
jgi:alkanesulfonate monooxygenase SsuD/methylene tetrahydromethanopterin reductase-like flavin-dependent oxidoreductase (luciferase family)